MPGLAYKDGKSKVACTDGVKGKVCRRAGIPSRPVAWNWDVDTTQSSNAGSGYV